MSENRQSDQTENTPLVDAAFEQDIETLQTLLEAGHDVNEQDGYHSTALHWAAEFGNAAIAEALLTHGADIALRDDGGEDAIYIAIDNGRRDVLRLLREAQCK